MSGVYALMDTLLPFEWLHYTFMKNALIAIVLLNPLFGMLGTMAVDNKMAFFSAGSICAEVSFSPASVARAG